MRAKKRQKGFTLLEALVAVFILTTGVVGTIGLIQEITADTVFSTSKLVASYLGQEGIEIVRNIRDTNWLEARTNPAIAWDEGIPSGDWQADYTSQMLTNSYNGDYLNVSNTNGFYSYSGVPPFSQTKFKRKITIFGKVDLSVPPDGTVDILKVSVTVEWQEKGRTHQLRNQENLYSWR